MLYKTTLTTYLVTKRDCPLNGFETPMFKYVPFSSYYDLAAVAACGRIHLHVPAVGRFALGLDMRPRLIRALPDFAAAEIVGDVKVSVLLKYAVRIKVRKQNIVMVGDIAGLDIRRFAEQLPINLKVGGFIF